MKLKILAVAALLIMPLVGLAEVIDNMIKHEGDTVTHEDGTVTQGKFSEDGEKQGHWILTFPDGQIEEGPYVDSERHGHWKITFPVPDGQDSNKWPNGGTREGEYVDGKKQGPWIEKEPAYDGIRYSVPQIYGYAVYEGEYVDGKKQGPWTITTPQTRNQRIYEGEYVDGKMNGIWTITWPYAGQFEEGPYVDGERNGVWTITWSDGEKIDKGPYVDGEKNGIWKRWAKWSGGEMNLSEYGPYVDGEKNGTWHDIRKMTVKGDKFVGRQERYSNGDFLGIEYEDADPYYHGKRLYSLDGENLGIDWNCESDYAKGCCNSDRDGYLLDDQCNLVLDYNGKKICDGSSYSPCSEYQ